GRKLEPFPCRQAPRRRDPRIWVGDGHENGDRHGHRSREGPFLVRGRPAPDLALGLSYPPASGGELCHSDAGSALIVTAVTRPGPKLWLAHAKMLNILILSIISGSSRLTPIND